MNCLFPVDLFVVEKGLLNLTNRAWVNLDPVIFTMYVRYGRAVAVVTVVYCIIDAKVYLALA